MIVLNVLWTSKCDKNLVTIKSDIHEINYYWLVSSANDWPKCQGLNNHSFYTCHFLMFKGGDQWFVLAKIYWRWYNFLKNEYFVTKFLINSFPKF
jgi:hypothetical protein